MINWTDLKVREEYNKKLLHEAEHERLVRQVRAGGEESTLWSKIKGLFSALDQREEVAEKVKYGSHTTSLDEASCRCH